METYEGQVGNILLMWFDMFELLHIFLSMFFVKEREMSERPCLFLAHRGPTSNGTRVFRPENDAMEGNSPAQPGLPPQPALGSLGRVERGEERGDASFICFRIT